MEHSTDQLFKEYKEMNNIRTLIEILISPLATKLEVINTQVQEFDSRLLSNTKQVQEIETTFSRLNFFNMSIEKLWEQTNELENHKATIEIRRNKDMQQIRAMIQDNTKEVKNRTDDFKLGINRMNIMLEEYRNIVKDIIKKAQDGVTKMLAMENTITQDKEYHKKNISLIEEEVKRCNIELGKIKEHYVTLNSEVSTLAFKLKGRLKVTIRFGGKVRSEEVKDEEIFSKHF